MSSETIQTVPAQERLLGLLKQDRLSNLKVSDPDFQITTQDASISITHSVMVPQDPDTEETDFVPAVQTLIIKTKKGNTASITLLQESDSAPTEVLWQARKTTFFYFDKWQQKQTVTSEEVTTALTPFLSFLEK